MSERKGLYREQFEHDNCGIGAVVNSKGIKSHKTVENALHIVENLEHRAGKDAEGKTGDGVGILLQISHKFFSKVAKEEGFENIAYLFEAVGQIEKEHEERYNTLLKNAQDKKIFEKDDVVVWQCANCGHIYLGKKAPEVCPVCAHPQGYFDVRAENYK